MCYTLRQFFFSSMLLGLIGCGEPTTSQLTERFPILRSGPLDMEFALIPSGTFRMGSPEGEKDRLDNERQHWVKLTEDYWMQTTEITRGQWFQVMGSYPDNNGECDERNRVIRENNYPVVCVNWDEVKEFVDKLNDQEKNSGYQYSLPTESQWEYATRAYTETRYSIEGPLGSFAWYASTSGGQAHPVGKLKANLFGLYDVHGNVWEWVSDWYEKDYPKADSFSDAIINPDGPDDGSEHVFRGGGWFYMSDFSRSAYRVGGSPVSRPNILGFRLMRSKI